MRAAVAMVVVSGVATTACVAAGRRSSRRPAGAASGRCRPSGRPGAGVASWWARALVGAGIEGDPRRWARVAVGGLALAAVCGAARGGPGGAVVVAVVVAGVGVVGLRTSAGRGAHRADARLPDLLDHVGRHVRGGLPLPEALRRAAVEVGGVHGREVGAVVERIDGGATLPMALDAWSGAHPRRSVALAVGALEVTAAVGGARGRSLDGVAATLRARRSVADEARALAGQARSSAVVLVALPVVVTGLGALADPRVAGDLLGTPVGLTCLVSAAVLDTIGACWMHRIVGVSR